ncbi:MAG: hypothetical protein MJZ95_01920 [Paludibacteraceae bacterium]|nr:hypothetical protein [Paludibacteraceae bacterium]
MKARAVTYRKLYAVIRLEESRKILLPLLPVVWSKLVKKSYVILCETGHW